MGNDFLQLTGNDDNALEFNKRGGQGAISVTANIAPKICSDFQKFSKSDDDEENTEAKKLNGKIHFLISSVCISKNGSMIWNYTDKSELKMKSFQDNQLKNYLDKIQTETLLAYGVYQIEADGLNLFEYFKDDRNSIMGLPITQILNYIKLYNNE